MSNCKYKTHLWTYNVLSFCSERNLYSIYVAFLSWYNNTNSRAVQYYITYWREKCSGQAIRNRSRDCRQQYIFSELSQSRVNNVYKVFTSISLYILLLSFQNIDFSYWHVYIGTFVAITILNYGVPNKVETSFKSHNE